MHIGIPAETRGGETRVAATPETVKKFTAKDLHTVLVQSGAGAGASIPDEAFQAAGANIVGSAAELYGQSQILLKVRGPEPERTGDDAQGCGFIGSAFAASGGGY